MSSEKIEGILSNFVLSFLILNLRTSSVLKLLRRFVSNWAIFRNLANARTIFRTSKKHETMVFYSVKTHLRIKLKIRADILITLDQSKITKRSIKHMTSAVLRTANKPLVRALSGAL